MRIYKYETGEQKELIIEQQKSQGYVLTHISNITEGNYLGFMKDGTIPEPKTPIEERLEQIELTSAYTQLQNDYVAFLTEILTIQY